MIFTMLYVILCALWVIFYLWSQQSILAKPWWKVGLWALLHFVFAPISLIKAINRIPSDFEERNELKQLREYVQQIADNPMGFSEMGRAGAGAVAQAVVDRIDQMLGENNK
jgi:hypothetical protein